MNQSNNEEEYPENYTNNNNLYNKNVYGGNEDNQFQIPKKNPLLLDDNSISGSSLSDSSEDSERSLSDLDGNMNPYNSDNGVQSYVKSTVTQNQGGSAMIIYDDDESQSQSQGNQDIDMFNPSSPNIMSASTAAILNNITYPHSPANGNGSNGNGNAKGKGLNKRNRLSSESSLSQKENLSNMPRMDVDDDYNINSL